MAEERLRVGIIGTGMIATRAHLPGWQDQAAHAEVVALADALEDRARRLAAREGIAHAYRDWRTMLDEQDLDVVIVATPNCYHKEQSIAALEAGANVLCEKPAATCHDDAKAMFDAAAAAGKVLFIGQSARFMHRATAAKGMIDDGRLGEIYFAETVGMRRRGVPKWGQFHMKAHSAGGTLLDTGVHAIDLLYWLMGNPKPVTVSCATYAKIGNRDEGIFTSDKESGAFEGATTPRPYRWRDFDVEDLAAGFIRLEGGATVMIKSAWAANIPENVNATTLLGVDGGIVMDPLTLVTNMGRYQTNVEPLLPEEEHGWFTGQRREAEHFIKVIRGQEDLRVRREEVLSVMKTLDALYRSAAEGREVRVE